MFFKTKEESTAGLLQLCAAYFVCYVATGVSVKYFLGNPLQGLPGLDGMEFLPYSLVGSMVPVWIVIFLLRWYRIKSNRLVSFGPWKVPVELFYIVPSGVCTGIIIPTTTLMYSLPISVMVAMVIMRGSVIIISRVVDTIQIRQGILKKKVYWDENMAVVFAIAAVAMKTLLSSGKGSFDFLHSTPAMLILGSYIVAYSLRIYIMNYYKNTRAKGVKQDNKAFYSIEQIAAALTVGVAVLFVFNAPTLFGWNIEQMNLFNSAISDPKPCWFWAVVTSISFAAVSFFSVFIFMYKGRTATFAGLVNRLTSLIAGTTATLLFYFVFGGKFPKTEDWISLGCILIAVGFLASAEKKRAAELAIKNAQPEPA